MVVIHTLVPKMAMEADIRTAMAARLTVVAAEDMTTVRQQVDTIPDLRKGMVAAAIRMLVEEIRMPAVAIHMRAEAVEVEPPTTITKDSIRCCMGSFLAFQLEVMLLAVLDFYKYTNIRSVPL